MEDVEDVTLRHSFAGKIADEQSRPIGELLPVTLSHILSLLGKEVVVAMLCLWCPRLIVLVQNFSCCLLSLTLTLELDALLKRSGGWRRQTIGAYVVACVSSVLLLRLRLLALLTLEVVRIGRVSLLLLSSGLSRLCRIGGSLSDLGGGRSGLSLTMGGLRQVVEKALQTIGLNTWGELSRTGVGCRGVDLVLSVEGVALEGGIVVEMGWQGREMMGSSRGIRDVRWNRCRGRSVMRGHGARGGGLVRVLLVIMYDRRNLIGLTIRSNHGLLLRLMISLMTLTLRLRESLGLTLPCLTCLMSHVGFRMVRMRLSMLGMLVLMKLLVEGASLLVLIHRRRELLRRGFSHMRPGLVEDGIDLVFENRNVGRHRVVDWLGRYWTQDVELARVLGCFFRWDHVGRSRCALNAPTCYDETTAPGRGRSEMEGTGVDKKKNQTMRRRTTR